MHLIQILDRTVSGGKFNILTKLRHFFNFLWLLLSNIYLLSNSFVQHGVWFCLYYFISDKNELEAALTFLEQAAQTNLVSLHIIFTKRFLITFKTCIPYYELY